MITPLATYKRQFQKLTNRPLSRNNIGVIEGMDHGHTFFRHQSICFCRCFVIIVPKESYFDGGAAMRADGIDFNGWCGKRHHNDSSTPQHPCRHGNTLRMIASTACHHTTHQIVTSQVSHLVVGTTNFKREDWLGVFAFEQDGVFQMLVAW
jgi:hypothetical protein